MGIASARCGAPPHTGSNTDVHQLGGRHGQVAAAAGSYVAAACRWRCENDRMGVAGRHPHVLHGRGTAARRRERQRHASAARRRRSRPPLVGSIVHGPCGAAGSVAPSASRPGGRADAARRSGGQVVSPAPRCAASSGGGGGAGGRGARGQGRRAGAVAIGAARGATEACSAHGFPACGARPHRLQQHSRAGLGQLTLPACSIASGAAHLTRPTDRTSRRGARRRACKTAAGWRYPRRGGWPAASPAAGSTRATAAARARSPLAADPPPRPRAARPADDPPPLCGASVCLGLCPRPPLTCRPFSLGPPRTRRRPSPVFRSPLP